MLWIERVRGLPHDGGIGLTADGTLDDVVDVPPVRRAAFDDFEAFQLVACVGTDFYCGRTVEIDAQGAEGPVDAESQPVVAGEVWVDPALGDGFLRGGEAGVIRLAERQAMTVEVHRGEAVGVMTICRSSRSNRAPLVFSRPSVARVSRPCH